MKSQNNQTKKSKFLRCFFILILALFLGFLILSLWNYMDGVVNKKVENDLGNSDNIKLNENINDSTEKAQDFIKKKIEDTKFGVIKLNKNDKNQRITSGCLPIALDSEIIANIKKMTNAPNNIVVKKGHPIPQLPNLDKNLPERDRDLFKLQKLIEKYSDGFVVLITSKKNPGKFTLPKGGVHSGETETETAIRETWEEAGINVKIQNKRLKSPKENSHWYEAQVVQIFDEWPESNQRTRAFVDFQMLNDFNLLTNRTYKIINQWIQSLN